MCYEVLITDHLEVDFGEDHQETDPHIVRVGWSLDRTSFQLGTTVHFVCHGVAQNPAHLDSFIELAEMSVCSDLRLQKLILLICPNCNVRFLHLAIYYILTSP